MLGKLRSIKLMEGDLSILLRIYLNSKREEIIENSKRFSKSHYGSRINYAIETAILEKRLIFNNILISAKPIIIHNLTDLQSCYNR